MNDHPTVTPVNAMSTHPGPPHHDRPRRLAVVVPRYGLIGGGERLVYELTERIAADDRWEVHVFANDWKSGSDVIHYHHVPILPFPRFLKPLSFALFARNRINRLGVDLIHTHERILDANVYSVHGIPHSLWVQEIRGKRWMSLYDRALAAIEKRLIYNPGCRHLLAVSSITAEKLNQAFDGIADRIRIVTPGVDPRPFTRWDKTECRTALRQQYDWDADDLVLLFVGMNFEVKGLDGILEVLSLASRTLLDVTIRLLVVGKGNIRKYQLVADALGIRDRVAFAGPVHADIERIYLGSDMFILLSQFDTFGLVVLEAMAAGLPVIVSRHVGARDVVANGGNGFVVDAGRIPSVADRVKQLAHGATRQRMGAAARTTARACSWEIMAKKTIDIYDKIK